jgi:PAS domain S-box-containing protein
MQTVKKHKLFDYNENEILELLKSNTIVSVTDTLGRIIYANANFCNILGFQQEDLIGETHSLIKSERHLSPFYKKLWQTIKKGNTWNGVLSNNTNTENQFWLDTTITPIKNSSGQVIKYVSIYQDVTNCYLENKNLLERENNLKLFIKNIPNAILSVNRLGDILTVNQSVGNKSAEEVIGSSLYTYIDEKFHSNVQKNLRFVFNEGKPSQYDTFQLLPDGSKAFFISQIGPVFNMKGQVESATISIQEVTKLKKMKIELKENEAKYKSLFKSINVGILVVADDKGHITEWNKGAEIAFGYTKSEIEGMPLTLLMSEQYKESSIKTLNNAIKRRIRPNDGQLLEMEGMKKNGELFPVEFALSKWTIGKRKYFCAMMLDISNRKSLESKLKLKSKDLELFLYRSAHDLKAPFSSAEGLLHLIKLENTNKKVKVLTEMLDTTLEKGKLLLDNLTLASAIKTKCKVTKPIDFDETIKDVLNTFSGTDSFQNIAFKTNIKCDEAYHSNPELLTSIFQNLIQNAVKYGKPTSNDHQSSVEIDVRTDSNNVYIQVSDNGQGVSNDHIDKIFDLYFRANYEEVPGSGLGLYIVKNIVQDLNGLIKVSSELNQGTRFEIILPNQ